MEPFPLETDAAAVFSVVEIGRGHAPPRSKGPSPCERRQKHEFWADKSRLISEFPSYFCWGTIYHQSVPQQKRLRQIAGIPRRLQVCGSPEEASRQSPCYDAPTRRTFLRQSPAMVAISKLSFWGYHYRRLPCQFWASGRQIFVFSAISAIS